MKTKKIMGFSIPKVHLVWQFLRPLAGEFQQA